MLYSPLKQLPNWTRYFILPHSIEVVLALCESQFTDFLLLGPDQIGFFEQVERNDILKFLCGCQSKSGVGVTKAPFVNFSVTGKNFIQQKYRSDNFNQVHICQVTPAKYELDIIQVTIVLIIRKKWENKGTEKIGLVTPTPGDTWLGHGWIPSLTPLTRDKIAAISQTMFSDAFSWMKKFSILIKSSVKFVPKGPMNNIPVLVQIMAWEAIIWTNDG